MSEGLSELREQVANLRESKGGTDATLRNLAQDVARLTDAVAALQSSIDRSRGALYVISGVSGLVGVIASEAARGLWGNK